MPPTADPDIQRLWAISRVCEEFGVLPSEAQRELDDDPEQLTLVIMNLRAYAAAKQAYRTARDKTVDLQAWDGNPHMTLVELHTFEAHQARLAAATEGGDGR